MIVVFLKPHGIFQGIPTIYPMINIIGLPLCIPDNRSHDIPCFIPMIYPSVNVPDVPSGKFLHLDPENSHC